MASTHTLDSISDDELLCRLGELVSQSRGTETDIVAHIGEVDERRLYAREACSSMFVYCTERLHLSEAEAYLRITVARAARKHKVLLAMLEDGRLHLSAIALLAPHLTEENRDSVLERARHASKRRVEELVAELQPRPDAPSLMRRLPQRQPTHAEPTSGQPPAERDIGAPLVPERSALGGMAGHPSVSVVATLELRPDGVDPMGGFGDEATIPRNRAAVEAVGASRRSVVEALSPGRYKVQFTASIELHDKLERLQALMRTEFPDGDLAAIIEQAVSEKLKRVEARRFGRTKAPRKKLADTETAPVTRNIPAAIRRSVHEGDGARCHFTDAQGRRCAERGWLEFHHIHPFGLGGDHSPGNIRLLCSAHNRFIAEHDYGSLRSSRALGHVIRTT